jgi:hypothetical protein
MKLYQVAIAIDQLLGTIFLNCYADETMSAKLWRCRYENNFYYYGYRFVDAIFFWHDKHCYNSYLNEVFRKHLPKDYK